MVGQQATLQQSTACQALGCTWYCSVHLDVMSDEQQLRDVSRHEHAQKQSQMWLSTAHSYLYQAHGMAYVFTAFALHFAPDIHRP